MSTNPELKQGEEGEWVSYFQQMLEDAGFSPGPIDGVFGPRTDEAVRTYQDAYQLTVDGIVGPETWGQLTWTWDWSEFPMLAEILQYGADPAALLAANGIDVDDEAEIA
jgi:Putative peptidoglycan binding domain